MVAVFSSLDQKKLHVDFDDAQGKSIHINIDLSIEFKVKDINAVKIVYFCHHHLIINLSSMIAIC